MSKATKFCRYCGAEVPRVSKICEECGKRFTPEIDELNSDDSVATLATETNQNSKPKAPLTSRKKIVIVLVAVALVALLSIGLLSTIATHPTAQLTDAQLTGYVNYTQFYGLPAIPSGLYTQGSANIPISGSGLIILNQVNATLDGNPMVITRLYAQGWNSPIGHTFQLPLELSINFEWDNWPNLTTHPTSTLTVTIYGYWSSSTGGTPTNPITLTTQETVQWTSVES